MINWKNLDELGSYAKLQALKGHVCLKEALGGEGGAARVNSYIAPMGSGLKFNYAAREVDEEVLGALADLAEEAQLTQKYEALYNGEVINNPTSGRNKIKERSVSDIVYIAV